MASYTYACSDLPGMAPCPGVFTAETQEELLQHIGLHASVAHGENPAEWTDEDLTTMASLITSA